MNIILLVLLVPVLAWLVIFLGLWLMKVIFKAAVFVIPKLAKLISWLIIAIILVGIFLPIILIIF